MDHDLFNSPTPPPSPNPSTPSTTTDLNENFLKELERLNPAQQEAVQAIEGPVLVVAGPGTGKTQIIAARIGNILTKTDTDHHSILCLTYTDAGTIAMRQRLLQFIGPMAYRVNIYTFHAFCNDVIRNNLDYFGKRELEPITELENIALLRDIIDDLPNDSVLKRLKGEVYYDVGSLNDLFRKMKEEHWTPEFVSTQIDNYLNDLPLREDFLYKRGNSKKGIKVGDVKQHMVDKEQKKMDKLRAAANLLPKYRTMMKNMGRYDYSDMILWVLDAFKQEEDILRPYQEQFLYVLVDEYQDTNGAQNEIMRQLIDYWTIPNVFVVGDDDQSIYEFQGARMKNIMDFYEEYKKNLKVIVLKDNYRSSQRILDSAKAVIDNNSSRLINSIPGLDKTLVAQNAEWAASPINPRIIQYHNLRHEEAAIVEEIRKLQQQNVPLNEVAVIYYRHRQAEAIIKMMEKESIPYTVKKKINILELPLVRNILTILDYIRLEFKFPHTGQHHLFPMMHFHNFGIQPLDAARVSIWCNKNKKTIKWREAIADPSLLKEMGVKDINAITAFSNNLHRWLNEVPNITLQKLLERIFNWGGVLRYILKSPDKQWLMQVLTTFFEFIKEENIRQPKLNLDLLLETIDQMVENKLPLELSKTVYEEKGVNFVTAHSAKGLEFRYVFLIGCTKDIWERAGQNRGYSLPDTITYTREENLMESARRLFYVAITRAKEQLCISFAGENNNGKSLEQNQFLAEMIDQTGLKVEETHLSPEQIIDFEMALLVETRPPSIEVLEKQYIKEALQGYSLSVSHLNKYLECPLSFYYETILRVPVAQHEAQAYGSAVHHALHRLFQTMAQEKERPSAEEFVKYFQYDMENNGNAYTQKQFQRRMALGNQTLTEYYNRYASTWNPNADIRLEYELSNTEISGVPVNGTIDKIEIDKNKVSVVDYKTGSVKYGKKKTNGPDDSVPNGGDYWRQIVFYKLLIDGYKKNDWTMEVGEVDFIEKDDGYSDDFVKIPIYVTGEELKIVENQIVTTYQNIMNHKFTPGCGKDDCFWCNFVKENYVTEETGPESDGD